MDPSSIFKIITNSTLLATRLLSKQINSKIKFENSQYCSLVFEDARLNTSILQVKATHLEGKTIVYKIVYGNDSGLFSLNETTGEITLAASLDREINSKHTLTIAAETLSGEVSEASLNILVGDVNDNSPTFRVYDFKAEVIEEDHLGLPREIGKVWATDPDWVDENELLYTLIGDGVDGFSSENAYFSINHRTGQIIQHRSLDRDPPNGKSVWKLRVKVHDGQRDWVNARINLNHPLKERENNRKILKFNSEFKAEEEEEDLVKKLNKKGDKEENERVKRGTENKRARNHFSPISKRNLERKKFPTRQSLRDEGREKVSQQKRRSFSSNRRRRWKENYDLFNLLSWQNKISQSCITIKSREIKGEFRAKQWHLIKKKFSSNNFKMKNEFKKFLNQTFAKESDIHSTPFCFEIKTHFEFNHENEKQLLRLSKDLGEIRKFNSQITIGNRDESNEGNNGNNGNNESDANNGSGEPLGRSGNKGTHGSIYNSTSLIHYYIHKLFKSSNIKLVQKIYFRRTKANYQAKPVNRIHKRSTSDVDKDVLMNNNCNLFSSLTTPLNPEQSSQLKYLVKSIRENQGSGRNSTVHIAEAVVTIVVKDINDNPPIFPSTVIRAEVLENGPTDQTVATVTAWDSDDRQTSTNAVLRYYLETNAVDQKTGTPIFKINSTSGEIKTAICCLDREVIQEYQLQVVAIDGGGLKGTGRVVVLLKDVNDNSPKFTRQEWTVTVNETFGVSSSTTSLSSYYDNTTLHEISVNDLDISNHFLFRVVNSSGWGWQFFNIRTKGERGELYALSPLDFEDERHRQGFKFLVQVTDKGTWEDSESIESSWVFIKLKDLNDNPPVFEQRLLHIVIEEDLPPNTTFTHVKATDEDQGENGMIDFEIIDDWGNFFVNERGEIMTTSPLDREGSTGQKGEVKIVATDRGKPPLSSTAVLLVFVTDVNDCPPYIKGPRVFHVPENVQESRVGILEASDDDNWSMGHGPPFIFELSKSNSNHVLQLFALKFIKEMDSGRGGAEIWTKTPLDREKQSEIEINVLIRDAAGLESTNVIVIIIDDINDNDMQPGHKDIYLWKTKGVREDYSIGRVFVNDPDDNDSKDKLYAWQGQRIPYFTLNESSGEIKVSSRIQEGLYYLKFYVSDFSRGQKDVPANVTLNVRIVEEKSIANAIAMTLFPVTPKELFQQWTDKDSNKTPLNKLTVALEKILPEKASVDIVSVEEIRPTSLNYFSFLTPATDTLQNNRNSHIPNKSTDKGTSISFSVADSNGIYYNQVYLRGYLEINKQKVESALSSKVYFTEIEAQESKFIISPTAKDKKEKEDDENNLQSFHSTFYSPPFVTPSPSGHAPSSPSSPSSSGVFSGVAREKYNVSDPQVSFMEGVPPNKYTFQVLDVNETSLVSPLLRRFFTCPQPTSSSESFTIPFKPEYSNKPDPNSWKQKYLKCEPTMCFNGGRCVPSNLGSKCICPGSTEGHNCKHLSATFLSNSFLWLKALPSCLPLEIDFKFLSTSEEGLLLYSGSFYNDERDFDVVNDKSSSSSSPFLVLQLLRNKLELILYGFYGEYKLVVQRRNSFVDGQWHSVEIWINSSGIQMLADFCLPEVEDPADKTSCYSSALWKETKNLKNFQNFRNPKNLHKYPWNKYPWKVPWMISLPLQVGGFLPNSLPHLRNADVANRSFEGCIDSLRINGKLTDLAQVPLMKNVKVGCSESCGGKCIPRSRCLYSVKRKSSCSCVSGLKGKDCTERTTIVSFVNNEVKRLSIKFNSDPFISSLKLKIKTTSKKVVILQLVSKIRTKLVLHISNEILCLEYKRKKTQNMGTLKSHRFHPNYFESNKTLQKFHKPSNNKTKNNIEDWASEKSVCLPYFSCCDGYWHEVRGWKYGNHLNLEADDGDLLERNRTKIEESDTSGYHSTEEFVIDENSGVIIGNNYEEEFAEIFNSSTKTIICIDDLRLNDRHIELTRIRNQTREGFQTLDGEKALNLCDDNLCWKRGCLNAEEKCKNIHNDNSNCGCKPGQTPTVLGCESYDPCLYLPCLHGGTCSYDVEGTINCTCSPSFTGEHCQWRLNTWVEKDLALPILILGILLGVIFIGCLTGIFILHRKRRRGGGGEGKTELNPLTDSSDLSSNKRATSPTMESQISIGVIGGRRDANSCSSDPEMERALMALNALTLRIEEGYKKQINRSDQEDEDDLREYAYEGGGSSSGSLSSAKSGLKTQDDFLEVLPLTKGIKDVVDLLQDLPDGFPSLQTPHSQGTLPRSTDLPTQSSDISNKPNRVDQIAR